MSDEVIDKLVNRPAVKSDIDFVNELLAKVMKNIFDINGAMGNMSGAKGMADVARQAETASKSVTELTANTQKLQTADTALTTALGNLDQKWREVAGTLKENIKLQLQYESELKKVKEQIKEQAAAVANTGTAYNKISQSAVNLKQRETELKTAIAEVSQTIKAQVKETQAAEGSYDAMNQELGQMRNLFRQLSAEERNGALGSKLKANITVLDAELKKIDATLGNFQRNVGNYKSGFNGLGNSINQLSRELPAFTYSVQTGIMAMSNNFPILIDNIKETSARVKAMRAEGQKVPGVFSQLTSALFSWGTALSVGITLATVYGKEIGNFFAKLFSGVQPSKDLAEAQSELNDELATGGGAYTQASQDISHLEQTIKLAKEGVVSKTEALKEFNDKIHLTTGEVTDLSEAEQFLIDNKDDYLKMMFQKALATAAYEKASSEALKAAAERAKTDAQSTDFISSGLAASSDPKIQELYKKQAKKNRDVAAQEAEKDQALYKQIGDDALTAQAELAKKIGVLFGDPTGKGRKEKEDKIFEEGDAIRKASYEIQKQILEDNQRANDAIVQNDEAAFIQRTEAAKKYLASTLALRKLEYDFTSGEINAKEQQDKANAQKEYKNIEEREKAIKYITDAAAAQRNANLVKYNSDTEKITTDYKDKYLKGLIDFLKKDEEARLKHEENVRDIQSGDLKNQYDAKNAALDKQYARGLLREDQYQKKKLILQYEYEVRSLKQQISFAEQRVKEAKEEAERTGEVKDFDKLERLEQELAALRIALDKKVADGRIAQNKRGADAIKKDLEELISTSRAASELLDQAGQFLAARYEREKNKIQEQIDLIDKKKAAEIEAINATTASEEEKAAKITILNARADAQKTALEQKQRVAQQKQARFEKAINIATIIQETAVAVVHQLKSGDPYTATARALMVGALGAAKLAVAIATPIPQYAEGTEDHPGGLAVVGDGGKKEVVLTPSGKTFITPDKSTLVNLPKGTKVFPDVNEAMETVKNMAFRHMPVQVVNENNYSKEMVSALSDRLDKLTEVVKNKETIQLNVTKAGMSAMHKKHFDYWQYIGSNVR